MNFDDIKNYYGTISHGIEKAYEQYKKANSSFWVIYLCFYTVLSLVPLFAILFSIGSWFGISDIILKQFDNYSPLKKDVLSLIITFSENLLENARGGVLAGIGFLFLAWTLVSMFSVIENALNDVWHVTKSRTIIRKISDYISFFIFIPLLFLILNGAFIYIANSFSDISIIYRVITKCIPFFSLVAIFFVFYLVMPNTDVKILPAFISSTVISIIFILVQYFSIYLQSWINKYNYIYGSFSVIFIFLIWIRVTWFLIILGAHLSYILQNPRDVLNTELKNMSFKSKFYVSIKILMILVKFQNRLTEDVTLNYLQDNISVSEANLINILKMLEENEIIISNKENDTFDSNTIYSLKYNADKIKLSEIYNLVSNDGDNINNIYDIEDPIFDYLVQNFNETTLLDLGGN